MDDKKIINMPVDSRDVERMVRLTGGKFKDSYRTMFSRLLDKIDLDDCQ